MPFIDQMQGEVSCPSTWRAEKSFKNSRVQTEPSQHGEAESQTIVSALQGSHTEEKGENTDYKAPCVPTAKQHGGVWCYNGDHFDENGLAAFLEKVQPTLKETLHINAQSNAFEDYTPNWVEKNENVALVMTLTPAFALQEDWNTTAITWNANGTTVACAYGKIDTVAWCHSKGYVAVWNTERKDLDTNKPHSLLEADSNVTALAFHPTQPSTLVGGTYTGEVILWNLASETQTPFSSAGATVCHREPVCHIQWLLNPRDQRESHRYVVCSSSGDAKVIFWSPNNKLAESLAGYEVQNKKRNVVGVLSLAFVHTIAMGRSATVPGVENVMLLGLESGEVYRTKPGSSFSDAAAAQNRKSLPVLEVDHFDPHAGPVQTVDCSPFLRNLFLTCSSDGSVRLYSTLERSQLLALEPSSDTSHFLYSAAFSPFRPGVVAAGSRSSHLHIYDFEKSRTKPQVTVEAGIDGAAVLAVAFNKANSNLIATGDAKGNVRVWQMSHHLSHATDLERQAIRVNDEKMKESGMAACRQVFGFAL